MKTLLLMRHAEAAFNSETGRDRDRSLTNHGLKQAHETGLFLKQQNIIPDFILTSDAKRTLQTMQNVCQGIEREIETQTAGNLFRCSPNDIAQTIQNFSDNHKTALVVNHNPTIHQFVLHLKPEIATLYHHYPPAQLCVFTVAVDHWYDFDLDTITASLKTHYHFAS